MLPNHSRGESINDTGSDASRQQRPKSHIQHGDITQNYANIGTTLRIIGFFGGGVLVAGVEGSVSNLSSPEEARWAAVYGDGVPNATAETMI